MTALAVMFGGMSSSAHSFRKFLPLGIEESTPLDGQAPRASNCEDCVKPGRAA